MKKSMILSGLSLILIFGLLASIASASEIQSENTVQPRYLAVATICAEMTINSYGRSNPYAYVNLCNDTYSVTLTMRLQRSENGSSWTTIKTWTETADEYAVLDEIWYVDSGYYYRNYITAVVYDANGNYLETVGQSSATYEY